MNFPQQPYGYGQPVEGYPVQQAQGYAPTQAPPQQMPYPPQPGYPPQAPPGYGTAQQNYTQPYSAPQGYVPPMPEAEPEPLADLQDFYEQPTSGSGPSLKFEQVGQRYVGVVARNVTRADIKPDKKMRPKPGEDVYNRHPDGRKKFQMMIPLIIQPNAQFPLGEAAWYVKNNERDELNRAMEAAGVPLNENGIRVPRAGDTIDVVYAYDRPNGNGFNATKIKQVIYTVGNGSVPARQHPAISATTPILLTPGQPQQPVQQPVQNPYAQQQYAQAPQNPYAQPQMQFAQPATVQPFTPQPQYSGNLPQQPAQPQQNGQPQFTQNFAQPQQSPPTAQGAPVSGGAPGMGGASPSSQAPDGWPEGVPFTPGLTPQQAAMAAQFNLNPQQ